MSVGSAISLMLEYGALQTAFLQHQLLSLPPFPHFSSFSFCLSSSLLCLLRVSLCFLFPFPPSPLSLPSSDSPLHMNSSHPVCLCSCNGTVKLQRNNLQRTQTNLPAEIYKFTNGLSVSQSPLATDCVLVSRSSGSPRWWSRRPDLRAYRRST